MKELAGFCVRFLGSLLLIIALSACSSGLTAGLEAFQTTDGRYGFFYPTGWTRVAVTGGPEVVFHDVINSDETLSLVISELSNTLQLEDLGSPREVGDKLINEFIAPAGGDRQAMLIDAIKREKNGQIFYDIEYTIHLPDRDRHELATVLVDENSLLTLATSTNENRWPKVKELFEKVINSFTLFY